MTIEIVMNELPVGMRGERAPALEDAGVVTGRVLAWGPFAIVNQDVDDGPANFGRLLQVEGDELTFEDLDRRHRLVPEGLELLEDRLVVRQAGGPRLAIRPLTIADAKQLGFRSVQGLRAELRGVFGV